MSSMGMNGGSRITCRYSCETCGLSRIVVKVPARTTDDWDAWMATTLGLLEDDHQSRTPDCAGELGELMFGLNPDA